VIISLNSVNRLIFVTVKCGVFFAVRTGFLKLFRRASALNLYRNGTPGGPQAAVAHSFLHSPAKKQETACEAEALRSSQQTSNCHPLAEAHNNARVLVLMQLPDDPVEHLVFSVAKHGVFFRDADIGFLCQLPKGLDPALTVVFWNNKTTGSLHCARDCFKSYQLFRLS
jgi:hypothetical protein